MDHKMWGVARFGSLWHEPQNSRLSSFPRKSRNHGFSLNLPMRRIVADSLPQRCLTERCQS